MGRHHSPSKRSSSKRKSSEAKKKKKSRRTKSKKIRHRKDTSSYSTDDSTSSISVSSSSSEDEHHRARSRRKSEQKGSKKRARGRSSSRIDKVPKLKKPPKKKIRREPSVTSISGDDGSKTRKKLRKKRLKRERSFTSISSDLGETESTKVRSMSCSPSGRYDDDSNKHIYPVENSSRRLRSVITVVRSPEEEERQLDRDGLKEEMVHDHYEYPSSRSNESNDEGDHETRNVESLKVLDVSKSDCGVIELTKVGDDGIDNAGIENKKEVSSVLPNSENDDLESILRLKALENMIKYKGAQIAKLKAPTRLGSLKAEEQSHLPVVTSNSEPKPIPRKTQKANLLVAESSEQNNSIPKEGCDKVEEQSPILDFKTKTEPIIMVESTGNILTSESVGHASTIDKQRNTVAEPSLSKVGSYKVEKRSPIPVVRSKPKLLSVPAITRQANLPVANSASEDISTLTSGSMGLSSNNGEKNDDDLKSSIIESSPSTVKSLEERCSKESQSTDRDGQFEQKTMSVMRGGEMVQVSYKVYIPKKAPALARRPLRR